MALYFDSGGEYKAITMAKEDMGCDAYLCCPGPSLNLIDSNTIKGRGRKVFGINTTYPYIKPDIWLGMDRIECYDRNILFEPFMKIFRGPLIPQMYFDGKSITKYQDVYWLGIEKPKEGKTLFDYRDDLICFVWHKSTLMVTIHLMVWMGARNIYFIGCDMGGEKDYYNETVLTSQQKEYNRRLYSTQVNHLRELTEIAKTHGINFYSATPNSPINEFMDHHSIDEMIRRSEEKTIYSEKDDSIKHVLDISKPTTVVTLYKKDSEFDETSVYILKECVERYLPDNCDFICLTDSDKLDGINKIKLSNDWPDEFNKLELFKHFTNKRTLYIDLSCTIKKSIRRFTLFEHLTMMVDFTNPEARSGLVMGWTGDYSYIYNAFKINPEHFIEKYTDRNTMFKDGLWIGGYADKFIQDNVNHIFTWDKELLSSYKLSPKKWVDKSSIVVYHGKPKQKDVDWSIYRPETNSKEKILHITNWGVWGGIQSVVLNISKEYKEYEHHVFILNGDDVKEDCIDNFKKNNIKSKVFNGYLRKEDVELINPKLTFLHNTKKHQIINADGWIKDHKTIRVHHGWNLGSFDVDLNWFVSNFTYFKLNYNIGKYFILPPVVYIQDYLNVERPERNPVVGRIQSQTHIGGKPYPQKFYDLIRNLNLPNDQIFIVAPNDDTINGIIRNADIVAGKTIEYLKEIDMVVMWQDKIETWGLSATEANLSGIPVVARRMNDGLTEQLTNSGGGFLVDTEEEFLLKTKELIDNHELRNELAMKGKNWLIQNVDTKLLRRYLINYL